MEKRKFSWKEALLLVLVLAVAAGVYLYAKTRPKGQWPSLSRMAKCTAALCWPI